MQKNAIRVFVFLCLKRCHSRSPFQSPIVWPAKADHYAELTLKPKISPFAQATQRPMTDPWDDFVFFYLHKW